MFTIAICDDDMKVLDSIQTYINEFAAENRISVSVDIFTTGTELLRSSTKYNIIFLDIVLQAENGIDIGTQLRKKIHLYILYILLIIENIIRTHIIQCILSHSLPNQFPKLTFTSSLTIYLFMSHKSIHLFTLHVS